MKFESLIIRTATIKDAPALLDIYSYYVKNTAITFEWEIPSLQEFSDRIENTLKKYPYIVAELDGKIVGYAYTGSFHARKAYDWCVETSIYIHCDYRKIGIGKFLLDELEEILKQMNILNVNACIATTSTEDEYLTNGSMHFHEKMGYRLVGEFYQCGYKFNRWYNMIWMEKHLGTHTENMKDVIWFPDLS